jgi:lipid A disaccharide synthetase
MTEFQPIWDATLQSFRDYFSKNKGDTMYVSQEVMDNYLKGMQESQRQASKVAEGKHLCYVMGGKRYIEVK